MQKLKEAKFKGKLASAQTYFRGVPSYSVCSDNWVAKGGSFYGCREDFCNSFKRHLMSASRTKYFISMATVKDKRMDVLVDNMDRNLVILNELEEKMGFEVLTTATYTTDYRELGLREAFTRHFASQSIQPLIISVEMDEIWASSPALLSMHALFMRLHHSVKAIRDNKPASFDALHAFVKTSGVCNVGAAGDRGHIAHLDKWVMVLENLLEVFPVDRKFEDNWRYPGYTSRHGITSLVAGAPGWGDKVAKKNLKAIQNATK